MSVFQSSNQKQPETQAVYLDNHATTRVDPRVAEVVLRKMLIEYGNPNSVDHVFGERASDAIEKARFEVANLLGSDSSDVHFTYGASDGIRLAIAHALACREAKNCPLRVAASVVEHAAVLDALSRSELRGDISVRWIDVDQYARINPSTLAEILDDGLDLLCMMSANNEVGTMYPTKKIRELSYKSGTKMLVDATQSAAHYELSTELCDVEYVVLSGHKLYGPKGVGALVASSSYPLSRKALDGHEGTPDVQGIAGFGEACRLARLEMAHDRHRISSLRDDLERRLREGLPGLVVNGDISSRLCQNLHISVPGTPNGAIVSRLGRKLAISTGAACSSGAQSSSHVLRAMGLSEDMQESALRIGLGRFTTPAEIERAAELLLSAVAETHAALA